MKNKYVDMAEVVARVKEKDTSADAFVELYNNMYQKVYFLALSIVKDQYLAQDVVQETFINVYNSIHTLNNNMTFIAWLDRITYNCALKIIAKNGEMPLDNDLVENVYSATDREEPLEMVITKEKAQSMMDMILELSPEYRTTLLLKYYEGLKLEEIASCMECSVGTVKSRLSRGKTALRKNIISSGKLFMLLAVCGFSMSFTIKSYAQRITMATPMAETTLKTVEQKLGITSVLGFQSILATTGVVSTKTFLIGSAIFLFLFGGGAWGTAAPSITVDYSGDSYTNSAIEVLIKVKSAAPVKSIYLVSEGKEIPAVMTDQEGVYKARAQDNGVYQVEVISWNGRKTTESFEVSKIDKKIPELYWYDWNIENNTLYCLVNDDLSGIDYPSIYQEDSKGKRYRPVIYNEETGEVEFQLLAVPFNIILYDHGGNFAVYKIESFFMRDNKMLSNVVEIETLKKINKK